MHSCFGALLVFCLTMDTGTKSRITAAVHERDRIIAALKQQEDLVTSATAVYTVEREGTRKEMEPLIRQFWRQQNKESETSNYIISAEVVKGRSHRNFWKWRGSNVRLETTNKHTNKTIRLLAFDGEWVRSVSYGENIVTPAKGTWLAPSGNYNSSSIGLLANAHEAHLAQTNRQVPSNWIYYFYLTPYSQLLQDANEFSTQSITREGKHFVKVQANLTVLKQPVRMGFLLDDLNRIVEREEFHREAKNHLPAVRERLLLSDYRLRRDKTGKTIWFPHHAMMTYFVGKLDDGTEVAYMSESMHVEDISFNVDIPDSRFVISYPCDAPVFLMAARDIIPPGEAVPFSTRELIFKPGWLLIVLCFASIAMVGTAIKRWCYPSKAR